MADDPPAGFAPEPVGPFADHAGPFHAGADGAVLGVRVQERHLNRAGTVHGGLLATLVDAAVGRAVRTTAGREGAATVSLTTDYLGPAGPGDWLEARTEVERVGGRLAFVDCSVRSGDREVVRARAVYALLD
jgi:acyl-coenzyme A thioesterase 13